MNPLWNKWTPAEETYLRKHYLTKSYHSIALHLNRTEKAIKTRISALGLVKNHAIKRGLSSRPWSFVNYRAIVASQIVSTITEPGVERLPSVIKRAPQPEHKPRLCQWIEDEPTMEDDCKCLAPVKTGKPYCEAHCARAYFFAPQDNQNGSTQPQTHGK